MRTIKHYRKPNNHQVCLFGTGCEAYDHYQNVHLAEKYDKKLHALMVKVGNAQDNFDACRAELHEYLNSRHDDNKKGNISHDSR